MEIGRLVKAHGIRGEVKLVPHNPATGAVVPGVPLRLEGAGGPRAVEVQAVRPHKGSLLLTLAGVASLEEAERLIGARVVVDAADLPPLPAGEFYWFEVVGLEAVTETGASLGRVVEILESPAHDIYVVRDGQRERLLPAVDEVVLSIDPAAGRMVVRPVEGLLDL